MQPMDCIRQYVRKMDFSPSLAPSLAEPPTLERVLNWAVDLEIGLIKHISELTLQPGEPDVFVAVAEFQDPTMLAPKHPRSGERKLYGAGAGLTKHTAIWATLGEAIERYAGSIYFEEDLIEASYADVADRALDPRALISFSEEQYAAPGFPFVRFDPDAKRRWIDAFDLMNGRDVLVPAAIAILGYAGKSRAELLDHSYSTGLAASRDYASAAASAIREVIERDAFMCHWYTQLSPTRLDLAEVTTRVRPDVRRLLHHPGVQVHLLDITTEFAVPCILTVLQRECGPGVAVGACCRLDAGSAVEKAIVEAYHGMSWLLDQERSGTSAPDLAEVRSFEDHTRYYLRPERFSNLEFLLSGTRGGLPASTAAASVGARDELATLVRIIRAVGYRVLLVDLTPEDVRQLGFVVVRAIIPGLQPLSCVPGCEHLDDRRLRAFCASRGMPLPSRLNLDLHPFP